MVIFNTARKMEGPNPVHSSAPSDIVRRSKPKGTRKWALLKPANKKIRQPLTRKSGPCRECRQENKREKTLKVLLLNLNRLKDQSARTFRLMASALDDSQTDVSARKPGRPKVWKTPATGTKTRKSHSTKPNPGKMADGSSPDLV